MTFLITCSCAYVSEQSEELIPLYFISRCLKLTFAEEFIEEHRKIQLYFLLVRLFHAGKVADVESRCHTEIKFLCY